RGGPRQSELAGREHPGGIRSQPLLRREDRRPGGPLRRQLGVHPELPVPARRLDRGQLGARLQKAVRSLPVHPAQPDPLLRRRAPGAGDHDEPEPPGGEGPPAGGERLPGQLESGARDPHAVEKRRRPAPPPVAPPARDPADPDRPDGGAGAGEEGLGAVSLDLLRRLRRLAPLLSVLIFGFALFLLHRELADFRFHQVIEFLEALPAERLLLAFGCTLLGYLALAGYDVLGFRYAQAELPLHRVGLASFVGYAVSNALGHPLFTGTPLRARFYTGWGVSGVDVARVLSFSLATFWLGFFTLSGATFVL